MGAMRSCTAWVALLAALAGLGSCQGRVSRPVTSAAHRSNVLVIVADDLGFSDLGAFGGEIDTPNLDRLALEGVRLTGFHTAPTCSPTRAMLLSGSDSHLAGLGTMAEALTPQLRGQAGYEGYMNRRVASVAELLHDAGYFTAQAGKWHLGVEADQSPAARGFERSYTLLQGLHNHFGMDQGEKWRALGLQSTYRENGGLVHYPEGRYSADVFTDYMLDYLDEARHSGKAFFAYLTFSEPHWPLQAPPELIAKYRGRYDDGPEALRERRLQRLEDLGLIARDVVPHALVGVQPWSSLTPAERADAARRMQVYAAMVDRLDQNVGRLVERLRTNGQLDDTLIVFMSDNGAEGANRDVPLGGISGGRPVAPLTAAEMATLGIDNSVGNMGSATSYIGYGPAWAQAATAPRSRYKGLTTEGGINTSAFITGPGVRGGRVVHAFTHVMDIAPTLLQLAGVTHPEAYQGHRVSPLEGHSWVAMLADRGDAVWPADEPVGWELFFRRAIRLGDWKAVYESRDATLAASSEPSRWWLYDVGRDPGETVDLSSTEPARLAQLTRAWDAYARRVGVVLPPPDAPRASAVPPVPRHCGAADDLADIPAGEVLLGEDGPDHPGRRTRVAAFVAATGYVTQAEREGRGAVFEVPTGIVDLKDASQWWRFVSGATWRHPRGAGSAAEPEQPVVQVSYADALAYARWAGRTLPTVAQWERAARGAQTRPLANTRPGDFPRRDAAIDGHDGLAPVGCYAANAFGLVDMVGNAWEWTGEAGDPAGATGIIKGGSFLRAPGYCANFRPAAWQAQERDLPTSHVGFRTVAPG